MSIFLLTVLAAQGSLARIAEVFDDKRALSFIVLSEPAGASSWLFYFLTLKHGEVSKVAPIDKLSVVFAVLLAVF